LVLSRTWHAVSRQPLRGGAWDIRRRSRASWCRLLVRLGGVRRRGRDVRLGGEWSGRESRWNRRRASAVLGDVGQLERWGGHRVGLGLVLLPDRSSLRGVGVARIKRGCGSTRWQCRSLICCWDAMSSDGRMLDWSVAGRSGLLRRPTRGVAFIIGQKLPRRRAEVAPT
jgi:hypothetical protein